MIKSKLNLCCALVQVEASPSDLGPGNAGHRGEGQVGTGKTPAPAQTAVRGGSWGRRGRWCLREGGIVAAEGMERLGRGESEGRGEAGEENSFRGCR